MYSTKFCLFYISDETKIDLEIGSNKIEFQTIKIKLNFP